MNPYQCVIISGDLQLCGDSICDENARCVFNEVESRPMCECRAGFFMYENRCMPDCRPGFTREGGRCVPISKLSEILDQEFAKCQ